MFTKKPESGESITKMGGERTGELKTPFTERPATYASKSPSPAASKMVPSIIGEDLSITGNVNSKGEIQVDGEIQGDIHCGSLLLAGVWSGRSGACVSRSRRSRMSRAISSIRVSPSSRVRISRASRAAPTIR